MAKRAFEIEMNLQFTSLATTWKAGALKNKKQMAKMKLYSITAFVPCVIHFRQYHIKPRYQRYPQSVS